MTNDGTKANLDAVAEWVGLHYGVNFDAESDGRKSEWIRRYGESHSDESESWK